MDWKHKIKDSWQKVKKGIVYASIVGATTGTTATTNLSDDNNDTQPTPTEQKAPSIKGMTMQEAFQEGLACSIDDYLQKIEDEMQKVEFVVNKDNYNKRICAGAYLEDKDCVQIKVLIPDTTDASEDVKKIIMSIVEKNMKEAQLKGTKAHEMKHFDTNHAIAKAFKAKAVKNGIIFRPDVSPEDMIRINQHKEIVSRIATILEQRELYMQSGNIDVFSNWIEPYKTAVKKGIFTPGKMNPYQSELENIYIAKTAKDWWVAHEQKVNCHVNSQKMKTWFSKGSKKPTQRKNINYKLILDVMYTYKKDGEWANMNYFFNPYDLKTQQIESFEEIEARLNKPFYEQKTPPFQPSAILGDVQPQQKLLDMLPMLRNAESLRLQKEQEQRLAKKREQREKIIQQIIEDTSNHTVDEAPSDKLKVAHYWEQSKIINKKSPRNNQR